MPSRAKIGKEGGTQDSLFQVVFYAQLGKEAGIVRTLPTSSIP